VSRPRRRLIAIHAALIAFAALTLMPFLFAVNNIFRTNAEFYHSFFSIPDAFEGAVEVVGRVATFNDEPVEVENEDGRTKAVGRGAALGHHLSQAARGPRMAWKVVRPYMINSLIVSGLTALGVVFLGSSTAYVLARYRFFGSRKVFVFILSTMMFPGVLTLVPSFMLVSRMGLLNTYWVMVLPYVAGGQVFAIFVFKSFFEGLPEDLFESARIDGAGHFHLYWRIVLPLSKPVVAVVLVMNILGTWNGWLWPFITNPDATHHVIASGLYTMATSSHASNFSTMFAAYALSSIPLLVMFVYATKPFIRGMSSGALKG
jgi:ABC-type glycerol-3-phosphate transport system permease component